MRVLEGLIAVITTVAVIVYVVHPSFHSRSITKNHNGNGEYFASTNFVNRNGGGEMYRGSNNNHNHKRDENEKEQVHVTILSNRYLGVATTLGSVCSSLDDDDDDDDNHNHNHNHNGDHDDTKWTKVSSSLKLVFHIVTDDLESLRDPLTLYLKRACPVSTELVFTSVEDIMEDLESTQRFKLTWKRLPDDMDKAWTVETSSVSDTHFSPLNLLRFYLPYHKSLMQMQAERVIHLEDDVILQKDIRSIWNYKLSKAPSVVAASCYHWSWKGTNFEFLRNVTLKETGTISQTLRDCDDSSDLPYNAIDCVRPSLSQDLELLSRQTNPESPLAGNPMDRRAFHFGGLTILDLKKWKLQKITEKYEEVVNLSYLLRLFRPNSLAFGLGLPLLAIGDSFQCYEDDSDIKLVSGLGFVDEDSLKMSGWTMERLVKDAFALHYNGHDKPWNKAMPTCSIDESSLDHSLSNAHSPVDLWQKTCLQFGICSCHNERKSITSWQQSTNNTNIARHLDPIEEFEEVQTDTVLTAEITFTNEDANYTNDNIFDTAPATDTTSDTTGTDTSNQNVLLPTDPIEPAPDASATADTGSTAAARTGAGRGKKEPSTKKPSTKAPSTKKPSTKAPSTKKPSTKAPSTKKPSTKAPSTKKPSTKAPSTKKPSTKQARTGAARKKEPSTKKPSTKAPSTKKPSTKAPSTKKPSTKAPSTKKPSTKKPSTKKPSTKKPSTKAPSTKKPSTKKPSAKGQPET